MPEPEIFFGGARTIKEIVHDEKKRHQRNTTYYPLGDSYELLETEIKRLLQSQASKSFSFFTVGLMGGTRIFPPSRLNSWVVPVFWRVSHAVAKKHSRTKNSIHSMAGKLLSCTQENTAEPSFEIVLLFHGWTHGRNPYFSFSTADELMGGTRILAHQSSGCETRAPELDDFLAIQ